MSQEDIDDKTQNAILQKMDKKEYESALGLVASEKCRTALRGLIELKGTNVLDTVEKMRAHVKGYDKAVAAVENLSEVLRLVTESGCDIQAVDPGFARGLEYYTGIIFELYVPELDMALGGGGRYDRLIEAFGGEPTPSVGMAAGLDRIALAMQMQQTKLRTPKQKKVTVIAIKAEQKGDALRIAQRLRESGVWVEFEVMGRKMVKALEDADKRKADYAVIVGERELKEGKVVVKDLAKRTQVEVEVKSLCETIWN
jgi:histidyl-tRNA synthetase